MILFDLKIILPYICTRCICVDHVLEEAGIFHHQDRARQLKFIFDSDENPKKKILNMIFANNHAKHLAIMRSKKYGRKDI